MHNKTKTSPLKNNAKTPLLNRYMWQARQSNTSQTQSKTKRKASGDLSKVRTSQFRSKSDVRKNETARVPTFKREPQTALQVLNQEQEMENDLLTLEPMIVD